MVVLLLIDNPQKYYPFATGTLLSNEINDPRFSITTSLPLIYWVYLMQAYIFCQNAVRPQMSARSPRYNIIFFFSTPQTRQQIIAIVRSLGSFCCSFDNEESRDLL